MSTPAERYAASSRRAAYAKSQLAAFAATVAFPLDHFQEQACEAVEPGRGVLVAAPTGAGKTIVGEFAVYLALATGRKAFYTTPIKALSNQKYNDLVRRHGAANVGLLTGDSSINGEAPVVVMTTEVLRNMMYAGSSTLHGLGFVVMDEVHYLADRFRGAVWEEVIIHLPEDVQVVSLSATVSNAEEFGAWLAEVRGGVDVIVSEHRPVPLWQHMMVGQRMYDLFVDEASAPVTGVDATRVNPELLQAIRTAERRGRWDERARHHGGRRADAGRRDRAAGVAAADQAARRPGGRGGGGRPGGGATRSEVVQRLDREGLLPAITFIFSRVGCEGGGQPAAARRRPAHPRGRGRPHPAHGRGARLVPRRRGPRGARATGTSSTGSLAVSPPTTPACCRRSARSSRSCSPPGGSAPCSPPRRWRSASTCRPGPWCIEKLVKFNGETHADITPAEYTQLTGRAGRRGHRRRGPRARALEPRARPVRGGRPGLDPHLPAALELPADLQHGGQPRRRRWGARPPARSSRRRSRSSRPTARSSGSPARCARTRRASRATPRRWSVTSATSGSMPRCATSIARLEKEGAEARSASRRAEAAVSLEALRIGDVIQHPGRPPRRVRRRRAALEVVPRRAGLADRGHRGPPAAHGSPSSTCPRRSSPSPR